MVLQYIDQDTAHVSFLFRAGSDRGPGSTDGGIQTPLMGIGRVKAHTQPWLGIDRPLCMENRKVPPSNAAE